jgi:hypothetical protein
MEQQNIQRPTPNIQQPTVAAPPVATAAAQTPAPKPQTPTDKVALAHKISAAHPDWTNAQVILAVEGKLRGAEPIEPEPTQAETQ